MLVGGPLLWRNRSGHWSPPNLCPVLIEWEGGKATLPPARASPPYGEHSVGTHLAVSVVTETLEFMWGAEQKSFLGRESYAIC